LRARLGLQVKRMLGRRAARVIFFNGQYMKALLFDIDGVLIQYDKYFSECLSEETYKDPIKTITEYYHSEINRNCDKGILNPYVEIIPFLKRINWEKTSSNFFDLQ
jgi:hypothetical protein